MPVPYKIGRTKMGEKFLAEKSQRLISLDVFRGITIAGMILVNNPGSWGPGLRYAPLEHANWNGWTPTDLIFPFFLFIVGVAMTFSFDKRIAMGQSRLRLFEHVLRRTFIIFLLGLILTGFPRWRLIFPFIGFIVGLGFLFADEPPLSFGKTVQEQVKKIIAWILLVGSIIYFIVDFNYFQTSTPLIRIPGVLQRIALCYLFTAIIIFFAKVRGRIIWTVALIVIYWLIMKLFSAPLDYRPEIAHPEGMLNDWIDAKIFGAHVYGERPDPEGLLSTIPAIATTLLGVLCGNWLNSSRENRDKLLGLFFMGNVLLFIGICMHQGFPINKKNWSSSYVVFTAGMALQFLGMCFYLIDIKSIKKWSYSFLVFGVNPIFLFFASGIVARMMARIKIPLEGCQYSFIELIYKNLAASVGIISPLDIQNSINSKEWIFRNIFMSWLSPINASLLFAITYIFIWLLIMIPMYKKKLFIKI